MMELWIDGTLCDLGKEPTIPITFDIEILADVEGARSGRDIEIELPSTPRNDAIFAPSRDVYALSRFNADHHTACIKCDDVTLFEGSAYLRSTTLQGGNGGYLIGISEGGTEWIEEVVHNRVDELDIELEERLNLATISDSWEWEKAVRFLPVYREGKQSGYGSSDQPIERVMLSDDYHPFISVAEMVRRMFAKAGYKLRSRFFESELGQSLYMSGDFSRSDAHDGKERCDFFARRSAPFTASADSSGRVYASKSVELHSVGPIVDTADPLAFDSDGRQMRETFNTLDAFSKTKYGDICFTPIRSVNVGFMLHLEYTTDYKVASRERLVGFDVVEGVDGVCVEFPLINTFKDHRNAPKARWQYRAFVFDHIDGQEYRLEVETADGNRHSVAQWSGRSSTVIMPATAPLSLQLIYRESTSGMWMPYTEDWALYQGDMNEEGRIDVVMDLRLPPKSIAAGGQYIIDTIWFGGAEPGMNITVGNGTTLRPYFTTVPGYNSLIRFKDVAPSQIRQIDLLVALGEMFNLVFHTDKSRREVYIEPMEEFYDGYEEMDISDRIDLSGGIEIRDTGLDKPQNYHFAYRNGDLASLRFNLENETTLGEWSYRNPLYGTTLSTRELGGKLFATTLNASKMLAFARSASLMRVGDMGEEEQGIDLGFTPRIVCYKGLRELPENEMWIAGNASRSYPYAAFVDEEGVNLCFEERNNTEGLSRYHLPRLLRQSEGQQITLNISLTTAEAASLLSDEGANISFRNTFRLAIERESSLYRLVNIEGWDNEHKTARCTFERLLKD